MPGKQESHEPGFAICVGEPYISRLRELGHRADEFMDEPIRVLAPNLYGDAGYMVINLVRRAAVLASAVLHGAVHVEKVDILS